MKMRFFLTACLAALLLVSCNKGTETGTAGTNTADTQAAADASGGNEGGDGSSVAVTPDDAAQPCNEGAGSENDGAAAARRIAEFQVRHASGEVKPISDFYGKPLVINFWGDWCEPCKEELPVMDEIWRERKDQFDMIAISVDSTAAEDYWKAQGYEIPMYHDVDGKNLLGLSSMPTTFFMDAEGSVVGFVTGSMSREDFEMRLKTILR